MLYKVRVCFDQYQAYLSYCKYGLSIKHEKRLAFLV